MVCIQYVSDVNHMKTSKSQFAAVNMYLFRKVPKSDETIIRDPLLCSRDGKALQAI